MGHIVWKGLTICFLSKDTIRYNPSPRHLLSTHNNKKKGVVKF